jgi:hypothetical protein
MGPGFKPLWHVLYAIARTALRSVMPAGDDPQTPECSCAKCENKGHSDDATRCIALAPALEHGNESNQEQENRAARKTLNQHGLIS